MNKGVEVQDLGLIDYKEGWDYQTRLFNEILTIKAQQREVPDQPLTTNNYLLFCEHPHVYTLGKSGHESNLLIPLSN